MRLVWQLVLVWCLEMTGPAAGSAIVIQPSQPQIDKALERGKAAAASRIPPDRLYAWFGSRNDLEPNGFLLSKLGGLTVMSAHFALRSATPGNTEIAQVLAERALLVTVILFGDRPDFAADSYMVLAQGSRVIKPLTVRFDAQAARTSVWPNAPAYRAKVVASYSYGELDPLARTRISVFPAGGGEVFFDLDFSQID